MPSEPSGSLDVALAHTAELLKTQPSMAIEQAQAILEAVPAHPPAVVMLATAHRLCGAAATASELLQTLTEQQPRYAAAHFEFGRTLAALGQGDRALAMFERTAQLKPDHSQAWRYLADHLMAIGDTDAGDAAYTRHVQASAKSPGLQKAAHAMLENDIPTAERLLKDHLKQSPTDVPAIRMLAEVAVRCGQNDEAEQLLLRCLELAPSFTAARYNYATLLHRRNDSGSALKEVEQLLEVEPESPSYRNLCAVILSRVGEYARSSAMYARLLAEYPANAKAWLSYGHGLKTEGRKDDCINAYRESIKRNPGFGEAYWSLANMKTVRFSAADMDAMDAQLANKELDTVNRLHFEFALGKAEEDAKNFELSFMHYQKGNDLHRSTLKYDAGLNTARAKKMQNKFTADFFASRSASSSGCTNPAPIFIVGMPRSGSTLLEQILSSHSQVEGTTELPNIITIAKELREQADDDKIGAYTEVLAALSPASLQALGEQYIDETKVHRKTDRPFFIDKMPNNFLHVGLIHLILPNAKIIDARRHPLACCFSNFKQYYARGQSFSYGLEDMGDFYRDYVALMAHYDAALPGRVHRVIYEQTVADTEAQVRSVLDYCGLPFEEGCLRFFENQRPVRTASSEQVRQPINTDGLEQWMNYESWLAPLKERLGDVLTQYPDAPDTFSP